ncbi:hypothetical protein K523DRAFT_144702 [Schizophyllum commune Tattone D]|nr:hypothetical protein K523DRAFT_144702 [Schizophyllum commune Tattone D]
MDITESSLESIAHRPLAPSRPSTTSASQRLFPVSSSASASVGWRPCQPLAWLPSTSAWTSSSAWHFSTSASFSPKTTSPLPRTTPFSQKTIHRRSRRVPRRPRAVANIGVSLRLFPSR